LITLTPGLSIFLNQLRSLAASGIVITHLLQIFYYRLYSPPFTPQQLPFYSIAAGYYCVLIFFLLSGFLITISLYNNYQRHAHIRIGWFLQRRCLRLWPGLCFALVLTAGIAWLITYFTLWGADNYVLPGESYAARQFAQIDWENYLASLLFLHKIFLGEAPLMNGPLWTLGYEFWVYVGALCMGLLFTWRANPIVLNALSSLLLLLLLSLAKILADFILLLLLAWIVGSGLAFAYAHQLHQQLCLRKVFTIVFYLLLLVLASMLGFFGLGIVNVYYQTLHHLSSIFVLLVILLAVSWVFKQGFFTQHKSGAWGARWAATANYAYTLYVLHFPISLLALSLLGTRLQNFALWQLWLWMLAMFFILHLLANYCAKLTERWHRSSLYIRTNR
jgi:peptidoglycan/LPS O-acetylase OafA/YrhL